MTLCHASSLEKGHLGRQVLLNGLLHASVQEFGMGCCIEEAVIGGGIVQNVDVSAGRAAPVGLRQERPRVGFEDGPLGVEVAQNRGTNGKAQSGWIVVRGSEHVMDQPAMETAVPIDIRMDINEAEGEHRRGHNWIIAYGWHSPREPSIICDPARIINALT